MSHAPHSPTDHSTGSLAQALGAELLGPPSLRICRLDTLDRAVPGTLSFIRAASFAAAWPGSRASAALVTRGIEVPGHDPATRALLVVKNADLAMVRALELFAPPAQRPAPGVHPSAVIDPGATVAPTASIGPLCHVAAGAVIGDGVALVSRVGIGAGARVGAGSTLHPGVSIGDRCTLGERCILHPGVSIGADGFGYRPSADGSGVVKIPHIGTVEIGSDVEIGANSCIDRAKFGATTIGDGTKIDNLVQIGHNCTIGRACLLAGQVGLAGSVTLGDGVQLGGQVGIADNLDIGAGARIAAQSGIFSDIPAGQTWLGTPSGPYGEQVRIYAAMRQLPQMLTKLRRLPDPPSEPRA